MERVKTVMEILDKMNFFQGQRAGRELWNDKPFEVQEEDLENFKRDINTIGSYIWDIVKELKQYRDAEEQGLLLRLPCKVGDVVWHEKEYATYLIGVYPYQITNVMISQNKKGEWTKKYRAMRIHNGKTIDCQVNFSFDDIGKTVFITKEEAEQALARMEKENG